MSPEKRSSESKATNNKRLTNTIHLGSSLMTQPEDKRDIPPALVSRSLVVSTTHSASENE